MKVVQFNFLVSTFSVSICIFLIKVSDVYGAADMEHISTKPRALLNRCLALILNFTI